MILLSGIYIDSALLSSGRIYKSATKEAMDNSKKWDEYCLVLGSILVPDEISSCNTISFQGSGLCPHSQNQTNTKTNHELYAKFDGRLLQSINDAWEALHREAGYSNVEREELTIVE